MRNQVWKDIEEVIEAHCGFVEEIMDSIYKSKFLTKCPHCEMEFQYLTFFKNGNCSCPICGKNFITKDIQGNSQLQSRKMEIKLGYYKERNTKLQFEMNKQIILHKLKINRKLASNTEELFQLRIHNKTLLTEFKKLKNSQTMELFHEDLE